MSNKEFNQARNGLDQWLDQACAGLPRLQRESTRAEMAAHLADAIDDYVNIGLELTEARHQALAAMGPASTAAEGFRDAYLGPRRYRLAAAASALILLTHLMAPLLYQLFYSDLGISLLVAYNLEGLQRPVKLAVAGLIVQFSADTLMLLFYGFSMNSGIGEVPAVFEASSWHQTLLILFTLTGFALLGAGMIWLSLCLARWDGRLFGLKKTLVVLTLAMGVCMASSGLWMILGLEWLLVFAGIVVLFGHIFLWPLMILLFFHAAYRPLYRPANFA